MANNEETKFYTKMKQSVMNQLGHVKIHGSGETTPGPAIDATARIVLDEVKAIIEEWKEDQKPVKY